MDALLIIGGGLLIFFATAVASMPFGFVQGFAQVKGRPFSERTMALLRIPEWLLEAVFAVAAIAFFSAREPQIEFVGVVAAVLVSSFISYLLEVRRLQLSVKEFWLRMLVGVVLCAPAGLSLGVSFHAPG